MGHDDLGILGYESISVVGHGGFGTVYRAEQVSVGREVALKVLSAFPDDWSRTRFERECKAMGRLSWHPHIVVVYDAGVAADGRPFISMEFLPNGNLAEAVRRSGPLTWQDVLSAGVQLSGAAAAAHASGVLHRDIKPANVLRGNFGETKLTDFGIARLAGSEVTRSTGDFTATVAYTAPEVLNGEEPTEQSDVYSLGATLFALAAGHAAFVSRDKSPASLVMRVINEPVPDLRTQGVPPEVCTVIEGAMEKSPAARPDSAAALGAEFQSVQRTLGVAEDRLIVAVGDARLAAPPTVPGPRPVQPEEPTTPTAAPTPTTPAPASAPAPAPEPGPPGQELALGGHRCRGGPAGGWNRRGRWTRFP